MAYSFFYGYLVFVAPLRSLRENIRENPLRRSGRCARTSGKTRCAVAVVAREHQGKPVAPLRS